MSKTKAIKRTNKQARQDHEERKKTNTTKATRKDEQAKKN
jgi:hypothetical protein